MPSSIEAEKTVLGTLFYDPLLIDMVIDDLTDLEFYDLVNQRVYSIITEFYKMNKPITIMIVYEEFNNRSWPIDPAYLIDIDDHFVSKTDLMKFVYMIKETANRRNWLISLIDIVNKLKSDAPYEEATEYAEKQLASLSLTGKQTLTMPAILKKTAVALKERWDGKGIVKLGFPSLEEECVGMLPGQLIILGARPSMGKTSIALSFIRNAIQQEKKCAFISLEMSNTEVATKLISMESEIPFSQLVDKQFHTQTTDWTEFVRAAQRLESWPLRIDTDHRSLPEIKSFARELKKNNELDFMVIDYLGLIECGTKETSLYQEVTKISRQLKLLAQEIQVPIMVLCQLNRRLADMARPRPQLHDLRDSGAIEQDADIVFLLHRQYVINPEEASVHDTDFIIAKQRLGSLAMKKIHFDPSTSTFRDINQVEQAQGMSRFIRES